MNNHHRRAFFDCTRCPAYCCSIYERVSVNERDVKRLARYFGVTPEAAKKRFTKLFGEERILRRKKDPIFGMACQFLDPETRRCTIYEARPRTCRDYPGRVRCSYYDLLKFERRQQDDPNVVPLVQITFREPKENKSNGVGRRTPV